MHTQRYIAMGEANGKSSTFCYKITSVTNNLWPPANKKSEIAQPVHVLYPIQRLPFHSISFSSPTHLHVTGSLNVNKCPQPQGERGEYKITLFSPAIVQVCRLNLLKLQVGVQSVQSQSLSYTSFLAYLIILMKKRRGKFTANDSCQVPFGRHIERKKRPFPSPTRIWQISVSDPATWLGQTRASEQGWFAELTLYRTPLTLLSC